MEDSILKSTKKMLGIEHDYKAFDLEITTHINASFSDLFQIGVGTGAPIEDDEAKWSALALPDVQLNLTKTLVFLRVKMAFDPPTTSYLIDAMEKQIREQEYRLMTFVEGREEEPV